jgi:putative Holliday junction resolvase
MEAVLPTEGRLAAIDYGTVRIGIAITDRRQSLASPLENYQRRGIEADGKRFRDLVKQEDIVGFVIGLPIHLSGRDSQKSLEVRKFAVWLRDLTGIPTMFCDERYTSKEAESMLIDVDMPRKKRKQRLDKLAAQILLSGFLDSRRRGENAELPLDD